MYTVSGQDRQHSVERNENAEQESFAEIHVLFFDLHTEEENHHKAQKESQMDGVDINQTLMYPLPYLTLQIDVSSVYSVSPPLSPPLSPRYKIPQKRPPDTIGLLSCSTAIQSLNTKSPRAQRTM